MIGGAGGDIDQIGGSLGWGPGFAATGSNMNTTVLASGSLAGLGISPSFQSDLYWDNFVPTMMFGNYVCGTNGGPYNAQLGTPPPPPPKYVDWMSSMIGKVLQSIAGPAFWP